MNETKRTIANLFTAFADSLNSMDDSEFELLASGRGKLRLVEGKQPTKTQPVEDHLLDNAIAEIAKQLNEVQSRKAAEELIAAIDQPRRKDFLVLLARSCGVSVGSRDNIAKIEQKLIENVVGSKLRSEAIKKVAF